MRVLLLGTTGTKKTTVLEKVAQYAVEQAITSSLIANKDRASYVRTFTVEDRIVQRVRNQPGLRELSRYLEIKVHSDLSLPGLRRQETWGLTVIML